MSKFLYLNDDGISVAIRHDAVVTITDNKDGTCQIVTESDEFTANESFKVIMAKLDPVDMKAAMVQF